MTYHHRWLRHRTPGSPANSSSVRPTARRSAAISR